MIYVLMIFITVEVLEYYELADSCDGIVIPSILWPVTLFIALGIVPVILAKKLVKRIKKK